MKRDDVQKRLGALVNELRPLSGEYPSVLSGEEDLLTMLDIAIQSASPAEGEEELEWYIQASALLGESLRKRREERWADWKVGGEWVEERVLNLFHPPNRKYIPEFRNRRLKAYMQYEERIVVLRETILRS